MERRESYDVAVVGGGLAGLATAIQLSRLGCSVILFEQKSYPFHRVCGEYISEESKPFLQELGLPFETLDLPEIRNLLVTAPDGRFVETSLNPGGFGISRFRLDAILAGIAQSSGVLIMEATKVDSIRFDQGVMLIRHRQAETTAQVVVGAFGKRSNLDLLWQRPFVQAKAGKLNNYIGVKYHVRINEPKDRIALHNFRDGYCGISAIEEDLHCLCYLTTANNLGLCNNSIPRMQEELLMQNPHLNRIFKEASQVWVAPQSISQVSFMPKSQVHDHVLLVGDSAGMITPLCGNGMSMALHGSKILAGHVLGFIRKEISRAEMEQGFQRDWQNTFNRRLFAGRMIQSFFGSNLLSGLLVRTARGFPAFTSYLVRQTHGDQF